MNGFKIVPKEMNKMKKLVVVLLVLVGLFGVTTMAYGIHHAMWSHGCGVQIETPSSFVSVTRYGFYTKLVGKSNTKTWVHFQIPTPLIVNNVRLKAGKVLLSFKTSVANAQVQKVHVYDGANKIASFEGLSYSGNAGMIPFTLSNQPLIYEGLNISVLLSFGDKAEIDLISAGCDFF
jgi:hypothetical protein